MPKNDYDNLLESFMNNSEKAYNPYFNDSQGKEDNMAVKTTGGQNKIAILFEVIAAIAAIVTIVGFILNYTIDFSLTTNYENDHTEYVFNKSGMDIKNASATLYYILEFPINDSDDSVSYVYDSKSVTYNGSNRTFEYELPVNYNETIFCEAFSYMYYDTRVPYNVPLLNTYIKIEYEIGVIPNIKLRKWYKVNYEKDTRYLYFFNRKDVKKIIKDNEENYCGNLLDFYNRNKSELGYLSSNNEEFKLVTVENSVNDVLEWIDESSVRPLSNYEKDKLVAIYKNNADLEKYEDEDDK